MAFTINNKMLSNLERVGDSALKLEAQTSFRLDFISIEKIKPDIRNFYPVDDIDDLAQDIYVNGLQHNIVIRPILDTDQFEIISGERRYTAYKLLYQKHGEKYRFIPSKIVSVDDIEAEILLIQSNATARVITPATMLKQVERLTALYETKKAKGEPIGGKIRELVGKDLGIGGTQTSKYQSIQKNLDTALIDKISSGELTVTSAAALSKLPKEQQFNVFQGKKQTIPIKNESIDIENSQPTGRPAAAEKFRYSYACRSCGAELYSNNNVKVRCENCNVLFVLGEF